MLNGDGSEKTSRSIDLINKKTNLHVQHAFCLFLPLFCTTTMQFCTTKTSNFLVTHFFYGEIVVCDYQRFGSRVHVLFYFFTAAHFHLAASISHFLTAAMEFSCFSSNEIRHLCFQSLALALSLLSTWA